ncbi:GNAT family N-acetyltransferase [Rhodobacteraceae bacterium Araon29]|tara:strand:- start:171 stop:665 length:495 start_codon:yes stop_codon:yes gene_type:complete
MNGALTLRPANLQDGAALWAILQPAFHAGDSYAVDRDISKSAALHYWTGEGKTAYLAMRLDQAVGSYYMRPNYPGGGAHVCNCGFVTHPQSRGQGIARTMLEHALKTAKSAGYSAMQFNFVLASNAGAIHLWQSCGFAEVGRLPQAFQHPALGLIDALVMHRQL